MRLSLTVRTGLLTGDVQRKRYSLRCAPAGGTMPHAAAACAALADLRVRPSAEHVSCMGLLGPPSARISLRGTVEGRRYRLDFSTQSWCGRSRRVMRDLWALSALPCSTAGVIHTDGGGVAYARWTRASGCLS